MVLDELLCRKAQEIHGWSLSFEGELAVIEGKTITQEAWMPLQKKPQALLACLDCAAPDDWMPKSYGFLDLSKQAVIYQEVAKIYPEAYQKNAYHKNLLSAVILHLRQLPEPIKPMIQLPENLKNKVHPEHFSLLEMNIEFHQEGFSKRCYGRRCKHLYHRVEGYRPLRIFDSDFDSDWEDIRLVLESGHIKLPE